MGEAIPEKEIWAFWHNRILVLPAVYRRWFRPRGIRGAVLTSPSKDGEILAAAIRAFGLHAVRGSSSKRPAAALLEMIRLMETGLHMAITPDGPRGPRYQLNPGIIKLAQKSGAPILPVLVDFKNAWKLGGWDQFRIPKPFSKVVVTFGKRIFIAKDLERDDVRARKEELRAILMQNISPEDSPAPKDEREKNKTERGGSRDEEIAEPDTTQP